MGVGARVNVYRAGKLGNRSMLLASSEIAAGFGYASGQPAIAHFGLANETVVDVEVILPHGNGKIDRPGVPTNQRIVVARYSLSEPLRQLLDKAANKAAFDALPKETISLMAAELRKAEWQVKELRKAGARSLDFVDTYRVANELFLVLALKLEQVGSELPLNVRTEGIEALVRAIEDSDKYNIGLRFRVSKGLKDARLTEAAEKLRQSPDRSIREAAAAFLSQREANDSADSLK